MNTNYFYSLRLLFDASDFPARWYCGTWTPLHGWTHIAADLAIAGAYVAIPAVLAFFVWKRGRVLPHPRLLWLFVAFILSCGITHLVEAQVFWNPVYRLSGLMKVITACASWATVVALFRVVPLALEIPAVVDHNERLQAEVVERTRVERKLRESERELRLANSDLTQFAGAVSHDLRAPLRAIRSLAEWTREDAGDQLPSAALEHLAKLDERALRLESMVDGLLTYATSGPEERVKSSSTLGVVQHDLETTQGGTPGATLSWGWEPELQVSAAAAFEHVLQNLVSNAIKHCGQDHVHVEVSAVERDRRLYVTVDDDGPGIPEEARQRVLELFRTLAPRTGPEMHGIGLALVKRAVERHSGSVSIHTSPLGGTRFAFDWPMYDGESA